MSASTDSGRCHSSRCSHCAVRNLALCAHFSEDGRIELERLSRIIHLQPDEVLFQEGDPAEYAYILYTGCIKLTKDMADGRCEIVDFQLPSDFLGLAHDDLYACTAEAVIESSAYRISWADLRGIFSKFPAVEDNFLEIISDELNDAMSQMLVLGRMTATEKLITFLLNFSKRSKQLGLSATHLNLPMRRTEIADYLGLTTESTSRLFSRLKEDGLIDIPDRHQVILKDVAQLTKLLESDEETLKHYAKKTHTA